MDMKCVVLAISLAVLVMKADAFVIRPGKRSNDVNGMQKLFVKALIKSLQCYAQDVKQRKESNGLNSGRDKSEHRDRMAVFLLRAFLARFIDRQDHFFIWRRLREIGLKNEVLPRLRCKTKTMIYNDDVNVRGESLRMERYDSYKNKKTTSPRDRLLNHRLRN
eukprot:gene13804-15249_t